MQQVQLCVSIISSDKSQGGPPCSECLAEGFEILLSFNDFRNFVSEWAEF